MFWTQGEIEILKEGYFDNGSDLPIGKTKKQIITKANKLGLKVSKKCKSKKQSINASISKPTMCNVDAKKFINPDKYASYLLGLLWGDGYLNNISQSYKISIECISSDLNQILNIFNKTGRWTRTIRQRPNRKEILILQTSNKNLYEYLHTLNYVNKSHLNSTIVESLNEEILPYWWRGYFDADGCFYAHMQNNCHQLSLSSSFEQDWTFAENLFKKLEIKYTIKRRKQLQNKKINKNSIIVNKE